MAAVLGLLMDPQSEDEDRLGQGWKAISNKGNVLASMETEQQKREKTGYSLWTNTFRTLAVFDI